MLFKITFVLLYKNCLHKRMGFFSKRSKYITLFSVVSVVVIVFGIYFTIGSEDVEASWFSDLWQYRKEITITNSSESPVSDYQVKVLLDTATLIADGKLQSDCSDLRFTLKSGKVLSHWIEENNPGCNSTSTGIWVNVGTMPKGDLGILVYYGNSRAVNVENGKKVFPIFDDFNDGIIDSMWTQNVGGGTISESGGALRLHCDAGGGCDWWSGGTEKGVYMKTPRPESGDFVVESYLTSFNGGLNSHAGITLVTDDDNAFWWGPYRSSTRDDRSEVEGITADVPKAYLGYSISTTTDVGILYAKVSRGVSVDFGFNGIEDGTDTLYWSDEKNVGVVLKTWGGSADAEDADFDWFFVRTYVPLGPEVSIDALEQSRENRRPIAYWSLDEGFGSVAYNMETATGTDGVITGATWQDESMCISGRCLYFDGNGDYVDMGSPRALEGMDSISIGVWVKPTEIGTRNVILGKNLGYELVLDNSDDCVVGDLWWAVNGSDWGVQCVDTDIPLNEWTYLYLVSDNTSDAVHIYKNGELIDTNSGTGAIVANSETLRIGSRGDGFGSGFVGFIDEVKIYPYARTLEQVRADFSGRGTVRGSSASVGSGPSSESRSLSDGLIAYWKFDESSANSCSGGVNDSCDSSGLGNDGAWVGDATATTVSKFGYALGLDGVGDNMSATVSELTFNAGDETTISAWYKADPASDWQSVFGKSQRLSHYDQRGMVALLNSSATYMDFWSGSQKITKKGLVPGKWYLVTAVRDVNSKTSLYFDGELVGSVIVQEDLSVGNNSSFYVGREAYNHFLNGSIDEVRVYNRALSPREVRALYNYAPGPVAYWNLDEKQGVSVQDVSGNNNSGTLTNGPTWVRGKYGSALSFDGMDDYVGITNLLSDIADGSMSVSAWFYSNDKQQNNAGIITKLKTAGSTNDEFHLQTYYNSPDYVPKVGAMADGVASEIYAEYSPGKWNHVEYVVDRNATKATLYINGVEASSTTSFDSLTGYGDGVGISIGAFNSNNFAGVSPSGFFDGMIDDVRIYNYARTQKQIIEDMNAGRLAGGLPVGSQVGYWKFDEGFGERVYDISPHKNHGTTTASWTNDGRFGKALKNGGASDSGSGFTVIPDDDSLDFTNAITVSAWVMPTGAQPNYGYGGIWNSRGYNDYRDRFFVMDDGSLLAQFNIGGAETSLSTSAGLMQNNVWKHIALTYDGNELAFWVDGDKVASKSVSGSLSTSTKSKYIGLGQPNGSYKFNGYIDEFKLYNYALSEDEMELEYSSGKGLKLGVSGTGSDGITPSDSAGREYCVPGGSDTCDPPVGEWKFEERVSGDSQTLYDTSGNENHGTTNDADLSGMDCNARGKIGRACKFDGTDDYVSIASNPTYQTFSWSAWVYPTAPENAYEPVITRGTGRASLEVYNNKAYFQFYNGSSFVVINGGTINANKWYYLAVTKDQVDGVKLYLDGREVASSNNVDAVSYNNGYYIGTEAAVSGRFFNGFIDQVRVYNYVRTPAQIAWEYNRGKPVGWWKFDECKGTVAYDSSGNGNHGALQVGVLGSQASAGLCTSGDSTHAWYNGATGKRNYSLNFDGTDDYVEVGDDGSSLQSEIFTISAWIKNTDASPNWSSIVDKELSVTDRNYGFLVGKSYGASPDDVLQLWYSSGGSNSLRLYGSTPVRDGNWHHVAVTRDDSKIVIYVDGMEDAITTTSPVPDIQNGVLRIGMESDGDYPFQGQIDDVRVYNYALTSAQVKDIFNGGGMRFGPSTGG